MFSFEKEWTVMTICFKLTEFQTTGNSKAFNPALLIFLASQKRPEGSNEPTLNVTAAWKSGYTGKGIVVGVVDDGVDGSHPELRDNYVTIFFLFSVFFFSFQFENINRTFLVK